VKNPTVLKAALRPARRFSFAAVRSARPLTISWPRLSDHVRLVAGLTMSTACSCGFDVLPGWKPAENPAEDLSDAPGHEATWACEACFWPSRRCLRAYAHLFSGSAGFIWARDLSAPVTSLPPLQGHPGGPTGWPSLWVGGQLCRDCDASQLSWRWRGAGFEEMSRAGGRRYGTSRLRRNEASRA